MVNTKTNNMAQTAVDWLHQMILPKDTQAVFLLAKDIQVLLEQAKEMQKQHHRETWMDSRIECRCDVYLGKEKTFEQYYNETYGNDTRQSV
jgi:hypothetical protein